MPYFTICAVLSVIPVSYILYATNFYVAYHKLNAFQQQHYTGRTNKPDLQELQPHKILITRHNYSSTTSLYYTASHPYHILQTTLTNSMQYNFIRLSNRIEKQKDFVYVIRLFLIRSYFNLIWFSSDHRSSDDQKSLSYSYTFCKNETKTT